MKVAEGLNELPRCAFARRVAKLNRGSVVGLAVVYRPIDRLIPYAPTGGKIRIDPILN